MGATAENLDFETGPDSGLDVGMMPRRENAGRHPESNAVLDPLEELRLLETGWADIDHLAVVSGAKPRIVSVEKLDLPTISGELDVPLAFGEEVRVFDAIMREDLGRAIVDGRQWVLEDKRMLLDHQLVAYVAYVVNANGEKGEPSNVRELMFERRSARLHSRGLQIDAGSVSRQMSQEEVPANIGFITQVTSEYQEKPATLPHKRSRGPRLSWGCRRLLFGTLAHALDSGDSLHVFDGSVDLGVASVQGTTWTFCDERVLRLGNCVNYTVQVVDSSGNPGPSMSIYMMTVGETND